MNKALLTVYVCIALLLAGCQQQTDERVIISGEIEHLGESPLYISYHQTGHILSYDTIYSNQNGHFRFKLNASRSINPISIYFQEHNCWTTVYAAAGDEIHLSGDIAMVDLLLISGGTVNNDLNAFKKQIHNLYRERQAILDGKYATEKEESEIRLAAIDLALKRKAKEFIIEHPSSLASVVLIQDFFYQEYDPITRELLSVLEGEASKYPATDRIRSGIESW